MTLLVLRSLETEKSSAKLLLQHWSGCARASLATFRAPMAGRSAAATRHFELQKFDRSNCPRNALNQHDPCALKAGLPLSRTLARGQAHFARHRGCGQYGMYWAALDKAFGQAQWRPHHRGRLRTS